MAFELRSPKTPDEWEHYFHLRWRVLREPLGLEKGSEQDELEQSCYHIGAYAGDRIIGAARIHPRDQTTMQIRYMAVDPEFHGQKVGSLLLAHLEDYALKKGFAKTFLNARDPVLNFYLRNGYHVMGEGPLFAETIPHKQMEKTLSSLQSN